MIVFREDDFFDSEDLAIVNTVNCVGVMGKGIALEFKKRYPLNYYYYTIACRSNLIEIGKMFLCADMNKLIINFPTKKHFRDNSRLKWIEDGLDDLKKIIIEYNIPSLSMPKLGCGNGRLKWYDVKGLIEDKLGDLPTTINIF